MKYNAIMKMLIKLLLYLKMPYLTISLYILMAVLVNLLSSTKTYAFSMMFQLN